MLCSYAALWGRGQRRGSAREGGEPASQRAGPPALPPKCACAAWQAFLLQSLALAAFSAGFLRLLAGGFFFRAMLCCAVRVHSFPPPPPERNGIHTPCTAIYLTITPASVLMIQVHVLLPVPSVVLL